MNKVDAELLDSDVCPMVKYWLGLTEYPIASPQSVEHEKCWLFLGLTTSQVEQVPTSRNKCFSLQSQTRHKTELRGIEQLNMHMDQKQQL